MFSGNLGNMGFLRDFFRLFTRRKAQRFGEIAVRKGLVSEVDVNEARKAQKEYEEMHKIHKEIGAVMTEKGVLSPNDVKSILEEQKAQTSLMAWFGALFHLSR